jgi:gamma-F420-2:alpha-L-glutamate ligase
MNVLILSKMDRNEYETTRLVEAFQSKNIEAIVGHPDDFDIVVSQDIDNSIKFKGQDFLKPRLVLVRLGAGILPFQLAVIRQFEQMGVPCVNPSMPINIVRDKLRTGQMLAANNIPIPKTMMVRYPIDDGLVESHIGFPCVVKLVTGSYGEGVYLCERKRDYKKLMEFIDTLGAKKTMIVQEYMNARVGEDLRVFVVGGKVLGAMRRTAPEGDFRANITSGGTGSSFEVTPEIEYLAIETARLLGLNIAGVDLLFGKTGFVVCEANSNPGFSGFERYCQVDVADHITEYIRFRLNQSN